MIVIAVAECLELQEITIYRTIKAAAVWYQLEIDRVCRSRHQDVVQFVGVR